MDTIKLSPANLAVEANHRVANTLSLLSGLVRMQAKSAARAPQSFTNAEVRLMLDGIAARISTLGQLHRLLAQMPTDGAVTINSHLRDIGNNLVATLSSKERPVTIEYLGRECLVLARHVQPVSLILCEILTNAMKYSHPAGVAVKIQLHCEASHDGALMVIVSDDGVGLPEGFDPGKDGGLGFQIMRALTGELNATLDVSSDGLGATFRLTVPQALVANARTA